ncbi:MAG: sugar phosphate isomerase/epimerase [Thaumarchaeota archaeon]|nr:sugar phosphate isomerase/epimerase [Nitrososphaerota archaeon]
MRLSCSAIAWGQIKDADGFKNAVGSVRDAGYEGVGIEYSLLPERLKRNPEEIKQLSADAGLEVPSMAINENTAYMAEAAKRMGAESGWLCLFEKDAAAAAEVTRMHAREFGKRGLKLGLHPHVKSNLETTGQLDHLISASRPSEVDVCFDSAHQEALSMDLPAFIEQYKDRLVLVHLKDLRVRKAPKDIDYDNDFVDLGAGLVDFPSVMKALKKVGYQGWLMIEVDFAHNLTVEESIQRNYDFLKPLF